MVIQNPVALVFDEYDLSIDDVMFVIRGLESDGNFTLLDKNKVLEQHDFLEFCYNKHCWFRRYPGLYHELNK